jgi:hypothetical protein
MNMFSISIKRPQSVAALFLAAGLATICSGCSTLNSAYNQEVPIANAATNSAGVYRVEIEGGSFQKGSVYTGTLAEPVTVQRALELSGAIEKYRKMDITILRVVEESGRGLKMTIDFKSKSKTVPPEQDYAIHPNDRILVRPVSGNALDKIVDSVTGG